MMCTCTMSQVMDSDVDSKKAKSLRSTQLKIYCNY